MSRRALAVVVALQGAALLVVGLLVGDSGWDDGAITLAFARTFARHGTIALTAHSEVVEGFSSVSWFLLNALVALARPSFHAAILASQVLAALCICGATVLLARTCALLALDRLFSTLVVVTFAVFGCSFSEASNGMEMGLLAAACLVIINELLSTAPRLPLLALGVVVAVTTRFEAILYVGLFAAVVMRVPGRRRFWGIILPLLGVVLLLSLWRLVTFADVLPNTFWAKRWPPYATFGVAGRLKGAIELPLFFIAPLLALPFMRRAGAAADIASRALPRAGWLLGCPVLGAIVMGALTGEHWGYPGRMPYFAIAPALLLIARTCSVWVTAGRRRVRVAVAAGLFVASAGSSMAAFPWGSLAASLHGGEFGVTPHTYAQSGQLFRRLAAAAGLGSPTLVTPDLGGLALCCDEFRLVDLGLLANRELAHRGPTAFSSVLEKEAPEMIEAHWHWASAAKLYDLPYFRTHYVPAFAGGMKLWLRRDVAQTIAQKGRGCWRAADGAALQKALAAHRYADHDLPEDRLAFASRGPILVLAENDPVAGKLCE